MRRAQSAIHRMVDQNLCRYAKIFEIRIFIGIKTLLAKLPPTHLPLLAILFLRVLARLPLHVARMIAATRAKGHDVVYDVSRTPPFCFPRTRAWMLFDECRTLC